MSNSTITWSWVNLAGGKPATIWASPDIHHRQGRLDFNARTSMARLDPVSGAPRFRSLACEIKRVRFL
jgi:hypothetical protein